MEIYMERICDLLDGKSDLSLSQLILLLSSQENKLVGQGRQDKGTLRARRHRSIRAKPRRNVHCHAFWVAEQVRSSHTYECCFFQVALNFPSDRAVEKHRDRHFKDGKTLLLRFGGVWKNRKNWGHRL